MTRSKSVEIPKIKVTSPPFQQVKTMSFSAEPLRKYSLATPLTHRFVKLRLPLNAASQINNFCYKKTIANRTQSHSCPVNKQLSAEIFSFTSGYPIKAARTPRNCRCVAITDQVFGQRKLHVTNTPTATTTNRSSTAVQPCSSQPLFTHSGAELATRDSSLLLLP